MDILWHIIHLSSETIYLSLCGTVKLFFLFEGGGGPGMGWAIAAVRSGHISTIVMWTYLNMKKSFLSKIKTLW